MLLTCRFSSLQVDSPVLVLLDDARGTASAWTDVTGHLPHHIGIVAPALHGDRDSLTASSRDLACVLELLARPVWLCGCGLGALVALDYMSGFGKERVAGLILASAAACLQDPDLRAILPRIVRPTLVIHGSEDDRYPPSEGRALAEAIPEARFVLWEGGGHDLIGQDPAGFARLVTDFVEAGGQPSSLPACQSRWSSITLWMNQ